MGHLTPSEFVDLAEGLRDEASLPHLAACDDCRRQLAGLREMFAVSAESDVKLGGEVPEPSPLFWDHLSARVREGVLSEDVPVRASALLSWPRATVGVAAVALVVAVVGALGSRLMAPGTPAAIAPPGPVENAGQVGVVGTIKSAQNPPVAFLDLPDDPSLSLVADYGRSLDWDDLREQMAVSAHAGSMDATVGELNKEERQELHRLLKEALARPAERTDRS